MQKHHGEYLETELRSRAISISEFSRRMNMSRQNVYNWFDLKYISEDVWEKIGNVIGYDFIAELYPKNGKYAVEHEASKASEDVQIYLSNRVSISIDITGDDSVLEAAIKKLTKINEVLKSV